MTPKQRAFLTELKDCPGEVFDDVPSTVLARCFHNGWAKPDAFLASTPLKDCAWWITEKGKAALADPTPAPSGDGNGE